MSTTAFGITANQRLTAAVDRFARMAIAFAQSLRVCLPAIVESFDAAQQTVDVNIATNEYSWFALTAPQVVQQTDSKPIQKLAGVPILIANGGQGLAGGGLALTFPIQPGDECMVLFADTPLEVWLQNGNTGNQPLSQRRHDLSDGIAIFGVRSNPRVLPDYSTESAQLRTVDGNTYVDVKDAQITVVADTVIVNSTTTSVNGSSNVTINSSGGTVDIIGGAVVIGSATTVDSRVFLQHVHSGVAPGGGDSGPVV